MPNALAEGADDCGERGMTVLLLALSQTVVAATAGETGHQPAQSCAEQSAASDELVVCAQRSGQSPYRLKRAAAPAQKALPKAAIQIAKGVNIAAETESADVGGFPSDRAMIRLKMKF